MNGPARPTLGSLMALLRRTGAAGAELALAFAHAATLSNGDPPEVAANQSPRGTKKMTMTRDQAGLPKPPADQHLHQHG